MLFMEGRFLKLKKYLLKYSEYFSVLILIFNKELKLKGFYLVLFHLPSQDLFVSNFHL